MNFSLRIGLLGLLLIPIASLTTPAIAQLPTDSLKLHLKADAGVTTDGNGNVSSWANQSGNTLSATSQATESLRPELTSSGINGRPAIRFSEGAHLNLPAASEIDISGKDYEIFVVYRSNSVKSDLNNIEFLLSGDIEQFELHTNGGGGLRYIPNNIGASDNTGKYIDVGSTGDYTDTNPQIIRLQATGTYGKITVNGTDETNRVKNSLSSYTGNIIMGMRAGGGYSLDGEISEFIIYNKILSSAESDSVSQYLRTKYYAPTIQTESIDRSEITADSVELNLSAGNGEKRLILAKSGSAVDFEPVDGTTYTANAEFGNSSELGAGNYIVYAGTDSSVTVTGLNQGNTYHFYAVEYNGAAGQEMYLRTNPARSTVMPYANAMTFDSSVSEPGFSFVNWGYESGSGRAYHNIPSNTATITSNSGTFDIISFDVFEFSGGQTFQVESNLGDTQTFTDTGDKTVTLNWEGITSLTFTRLSGSGAGFEMDNVAYEVNTPTVQTSNLTTSNVTSSSLQLNLTEGNGAQRLIIAKNSSAVDFEPEDGTTYTPNAEFGSSEELGTGNYVVYAGTGSSVNITGLSTENTYHFYAVEYNGGSGTEKYLLSNPARTDMAIPAETPTIQTSSLAASNLTSTSVQLDFTAGNGEKRIIIAKNNSAVDFEPVDEKTYSANSSFGTSPELGTGNYVVYTGTGTSATVTGLNPDESYHFYAVEFNGSSGNEQYLQTNPERIDILTKAETPTVQASNLTPSNLTTTLVRLNVDTGNGERRLIIAKSGSAVDFEPVDGTTYTANSEFGGSAELGTGNYVVYAGISDTVTVKGLNPDNTYHFYAVEYNGSTGNEQYLRTNPERNDITTPAETPTVQVSNLTASNITSTSVQLDLTAGNGERRLVVAKNLLPVDFEPVDGTSYTANAEFGSSTEQGLGNYVVYAGTGSSVSITGLSPENIYHFYVVEFNGSTGNEQYLRADPERVTITTKAETPTVQASNLTASNLSNNSVKLNFDTGNGDNTLIIAKKGSAVDFEPLDGNSYTADSEFASSSELGTGNYVVYAGTGDTARVTGLSPNETYHFYAVEFNGGSGSEAYLKTNPARMNVTTNALPSQNLAMHLKADVGLETDGSGNISGWADQSGNGNDAGQTNGANRPSVVSNSINGEPALRFNGSNHFLTMPSTTDLGIVNNDYQIFIIAKTASATSSVYFLMGAESNTEQFEIHTNGPKGVRYIPKTSIYIDEGTTGYYTDGNVHLFQVEATDSYGLLRVDGIGVANISVNSHSSESGNILLGTRSGGNLWFNGDIAEVIVYNSVLTLNNRQAVEEYLKVKYDIDQPLVEPTVQASDITASEVTSNSMKISLTPGNGDGRLIVASTDTISASPTDQVTYSANSNFGSGDEIGAGNFVVYNGSGSEVTVTGLNSNTAYYFEAFEYDANDSGVDYLTTSTDSVIQNTTIAPPRIVSTSFRDSLNSAVFSAEIKSYSSTEYRMYWGKNKASYSDSVTVYPDTAATKISEIIYGLTENTTYFAEVRALTDQDTVISDPVVLYYQNSTIPSDSLSVWLAADQAFSDVQGSEGVSVWYDLSGNQHHGTQASTSNQPEFVTNQINGLPAIRFDGENSYLSLPNSQELGLINEDYEIIIVSSSSSSEEAFLIGDGHTSEFAPNMILNHVNSNRGFWFKGNTNSGNGFGVGEQSEFTNGEYQVFNVTGTDTEGQIRIDHVLKGIDQTESYRSSVNGSWNVGAYIPPEESVLSQLEGEIAEIVIYNRELTKRERYEVHKYLSEKYALDLPLDTPTEQITDLSFERSGSTTAELSFSPGNGTFNLAIIKEGSAVDESPVDSTGYSASGEFGSGSEIGSGNFVVLADTDTTISISGLSQEKTYYAEVFSFNGEEGYQKYLTIGTDTASLYLTPIVTISSLSPTPFSNSSTKNTNIEVTFSDAMNAASFTTDSSFVVRGNVSGTHSGTIALSEGDTKASFSSNKSFSAGETVTVTVGKQLEGLNFIFEDSKTHSFTISTSPSSATFEKITDVNFSGNTAAKQTSASASVADGVGTLSLGDMNGDGLPDIIVSDMENGLGIFTNNGDSTYSSPTVLDLNDSVDDLLLADFDNDGDLDIAAPGYSQVSDSTIIRVIRNNGDGIYTTNEEYITSDNIYALRSGDLDNDGDVDFVVYDSGGIRVYKNEGSSFTRGSNYTTGYYNSGADLIISDLNNDGYADLIISEQYNNVIYWLENDQEAGFSNKQTLATFDEPKQISIADVNNDGKGDLISGSTDDTDLYISLDNGDGTFESPQTYRIDDYALEIQPFDAEGDGDLDVFSVSGSDYSVIANNGNGAFPKEYSNSTGSSMTGWQLADMDNNGTVDFVKVSNNGIEVYSNTKYEPLVITGSEGWRLLASPSGTVAFSNIFSGLWTQGFAGASTEQGVSNMYVWPKDSAGSSSTNWTSITNLSDSLESGQGMLAYIYSDDNYDGPGNAGFPKEIAFPGAEPRGTQYFGNQELNTNENGWTLLGNPFYKKIDWDDVNRNEISSSVYVYDADSAQWKSWNGFTGSLAGGMIDIYDAFFVQSSNNDPYISISYPSEDNGSLEKEVSSKQEIHSFSLRLTSSHSRYSNKAWFQFSEESSLGIDIYDAHKLTPLSSKYTLLASRLEDETLLDINALPLIKEEIIIPLYHESAKKGQFTFSLGDNNLPEGWVVKLIDHESEKRISLDKPYAFTDSQSVAKKQKAGLKPINLMEPTLKAKTDQNLRFSLVVRPAVATVNEAGSGLPKEIGLSQNYPNPFNPSTVINYQLPEQSQVELRVYDILGREVATLVDESMKAGYHSVPFNAGRLASGIYLYRLKAGNTVFIKKLTLIK